MDQTGIKTAGAARDEKGTSNERKQGGSMKHLLLLTIFLLTACKQSETTKITEVERIPLVRITVIDNNEIIFQKQGNIKCNKIYNCYEYTPSGKMNLKIDKGKYATVISEEYPDKKGETVFPADREYPE